MGKGIERTQILRRDCDVCRGRGYTEKAGNQTQCDKCDGSGLLEKEVPYKFETKGEWTPEETAEAFEISPEEFEDKGHDHGGQPLNTGNHNEEEAAS